MTVNEAHLIYFSPTHTSKQVAEAIVHGTGIKNILPINVTQQIADEIVIPASALAIIVCTKQAFGQSFDLFHPDI